MVKEGDWLMCKTPYNINGILAGRFPVTASYVFITGNNYEVTSDPNLSLENEVYVSINKMITGGMWFTTKRKNMVPYLWDYFFTPSEVRKMKLKKVMQ